MGPIMGVRQRWRSCAHLLVQSMTPVLLALVWKLLLPALLIVALVERRFNPDQLAADPPPTSWRPVPTFHSLSPRR
jgi:hypothetical protein